MSYAIVGSLQTRGTFVVKPSTITDISVVFWCACVSDFGLSKRSNLLYEAVRLLPYTILFNYIALIIASSKFIVSSCPCTQFSSRVHLKCDGTRWRTGREVKRKLVNGVGSQYPSHYLGTWCIQHYYRWCAHLGCQQSTELTPRRFKWTRPFRRKTKSGFCACAITFQTQSTVQGLASHGTPQI
jgi:hypothetical protein